MSESSLTSSKKRIDVIDALRGFALAGILYAHMVIWYTGAALPPEVYSKYDSTADGVAMGIFGGLVFGKFFSVFSFLFGLGFYLHFRGNSAKAGFYKLYIWRLLLLFLIGLIHHIIWRGDILAIYAVLGVLLLAFRSLPIKLILFMSLVLITGLPNHIYDIFQNVVLDFDVHFPMEEQAEKYYALVQDAGISKVLRENWESWPAKIKYQMKSGRLLMTFGYFLLGLYAGRRGLFTSLEKNLDKFRNWNKHLEKVIVGLLLVGLLMYLKDYVSLPEIKIEPRFKWPANFLFDIYNACLTIFYITGFSILYRRKFFHAILKPLAVMGRMALTNYLLQTFFGLLLFYHFGMGLFDKTSPAINVLLAIGVFYIQLKFSQIWLKRYRQGPVEWLWKGLTYFRFPKLRKNSSA